MRRYCSSQQGKPLAGASARGLGGFGQDLRSIWQPNSRLGRRSARACAEADFWETKRHYLTAPTAGDCTWQLSRTGLATFWDPPTNFAKLENSPNWLKKSPPTVVGKENTRVVPRSSFHFPMLRENMSQLINDNFTQAGNCCNSFNSIIYIFSVIIHTNLFLTCYIFSSIEILQTIPCIVQGDFLQGKK